MDRSPQIRHMFISKYLNMVMKINTQLRNRQIDHIIRIDDWCGSGLECYRGIVLHRDCITEGLYYRGDCITEVIVLQRDCTTEGLYCRGIVLQRYCITEGCITDGLYYRGIVLHRDCITEVLYYRGIV